MLLAKEQDLKPDFAIMAVPVLASKLRNAQIIIRVPLALAPNLG